MLGLMATTGVTEKTSLRVMKCEKCGGPLVRSKSFSHQGNFMSWQKPWSSWLKMSVPIWMWACMKCGKVEFYLKESEEIVAEFNQMVGKGDIEVDYIESSDKGGATTDSGDRDRKGGFQRIK